jgi:hypothetical protein
MGYSTQAIRIAPPTNITNDLSAYTQRSRFVGREWNASVADAAAANRLIAAR